MQTLFVTKTHNEQNQEEAAAASTADLASTALANGIHISVEAADMQDGWLN